MESLRLGAPMLVLAFLLVAMGAAGSSFAQRPASSASDVRHVVLISIDTLRADHLGSYGHPRQTTPHIDRIAREGILFANSISPVPITLPAHASMLTGTIPPYHGVHDDLHYRLSRSQVTLAETLKDQGFTTGAIVGASVLDARFGLDQGFDDYDDRFERRSHTFSKAVAERRAEEVSRHAVRWLQKHRNESFFLFLHYYDPHYAYRPPEPFASSFPDDPYAGEIAYTDHCIGEVIKTLKDLGLYASTLIVVTADHGELLGEHGETGHGYFIYQGAVRVPLIFKPPGRDEAKTISDTVSLIDIVPTICGMLGIEPPEQVQGEDRSGLFKGEPGAGGEAAVYCESLTPTQYDANSLLGMVGGRWKYIQTTRPELYDLVEDPAETKNLVDQHPERARILRERLRRVLDESLREDAAGTGTEVQEETRKRPEAPAGVTGTGVRASFDFGQSRDDPKDVIDFHSSRSRMTHLVFQEEYAAARVLGEEMAARRPGFPETYRYLAEIARHEGDTAAEVAHLRRLLEIDPRDSRVQNRLGRLRHEEGNVDEAMQHYRRAIQIDPDAGEAQRNLASALAGVGRLDEAIEHYNRALQIDPRHAGTHSQLGAVLAQQGRLDDAVEQYREALKIDPEAGEAHYELGSILAGQGRLREAFRHYTRAAEINPRNDSAHESLGLILAQQGRTKEAAEHFLVVLRINPRNAKASYNLGLALAGEGRIREAVGLYRRALALDPGLTEARVNLGRSLAQQGETDEAIEQFTAALEIDPRHAGARVGMGMALARQGRVGAAIEQYNEALKLNPEIPEAYHSLGSARLQQGQVGEAIEAWKKALELNPDWPEVLNNVAWLQATREDARFRNPQEAVELARRACRLTGYRNVDLLETLAVAYAAAGDFPAAIEIVETALELAESTGRKDFPGKAREHLERFRAGRPYREATP